MLESSDNHVSCKQMALRSYSHCFFKFSNFILILSTFALRLWQIKRSIVKVFFLFFYFIYSSSLKETVTVVQRLMRILPGLYNRRPWLLSQSWTCDTHQQVNPKHKITNIQYNVDHPGVIVSPSQCPVLHNQYGVKTTSRRNLDTCIMYTVTLPRGIMCMCPDATLMSI